MNNNSSVFLRDRALVLGGGGSTGNAWMIGVVAGLADAGVDVAAADLTVGTSAGSTVAAQLAGSTAGKLYTAILDSPMPERPAAAVPSRPIVDHLERLRGIIAASEDAADFRRRMGAAALERLAVSDGSWQEHWRATVALRFPGAVWPDRDVLITAVHAETGEPIVFDSTSGVDLVDAVAASCSSGLPFAIDGRSYIDGGYRTNAENADLAAGSARVLVLAPFGGGTLTPTSWGMGLVQQVEKLRAGGSRVDTLVPGPEFDHLFGANAMNAALRVPAARAGFELGAAQAELVGHLWG